MKLGVVLLFLVMLLSSACSGGKSFPSKGLIQSEAQVSKDNTIPLPTPTITPFPTPTPTPGLPAPNHAMNFGYYFVDGKYGDFSDEVDCYTNLYYAWARMGYQFSTDDTDDMWLERMEEGVEKAFNKGKVIHLNLSMQDPNIPIPVDRVLKMMKPYWKNVETIEMADEPSWSQQETQNQIQDLRGRIKALGLRIPKIGIVYTREQVLNEDAIFAQSLDWVGIEAYVDATSDGNNDSQKNLKKLNNIVNAAKARVPSSKDIILVMQSYSRNFAWKNIDTLVELQIPTYYLGYKDDRVIAITMFAYGRPSGVKSHPQLSVPHKKIGNAILGASCQ